MQVFLTTNKGNLWALPLCLLVSNLLKTMKSEEWRMMNCGLKTTLKVLLRYDRFKLGGAAGKYCLQNYKFIIYYWFYFAYFEIGDKGNLIKKIKGRELFLAFSFLLFFASWLNFNIFLLCRGCICCFSCGWCFFFLYFNSWCNCVRCSLCIWWF